MRAKPEMKPWVRTDESRLSSVGAALTARAFGLYCCGLWLCIRWESAAPTGLNKCEERLTQGLHPGLYRSVALAGLFSDKSKINVSACACCSECAYSIDTIALCVVLAALLLNIQANYECL